jgi:hypothetical protein
VADVVAKTMPTGIRVAAGWVADSRIDRQFDPAGPKADLELPALAFCLLFRFQGAEALARTVVLGAGSGLEPVSTLWAGVGAGPFRRGEPFREAEIEHSSSGGPCNPPHEKTSTR